MSAALTAVNDPTLPPRYVMDNYKRAYYNVHGREPAVRYMGNHWYHVNGETVHRLTLIEEITRLHEIGQVHKPVRPEKSVIQRLIARLRSL
ncbi:MAG: hypothetical protein UZ15_CFX003000658 [Chloroflexi bacterium OLB15]|nr:MAG: hypothetical protein UZ15_CFX003000658 [Chloroflexi bacterium OLB15]